MKPEDEELLDDPEEYFKQQEWEQFINNKTLTKREELAARNYAHLIGNASNPEAELEVFARIAVQGADALLNELNQ